MKKTNETTPPLPDVPESVLLFYREKKNAHQQNLDRRDELAREEKKLSDSVVAWRTEMQKEELKLNLLRQEKRQLESNLRTSGNALEVAIRQVDACGAIRGELDNYLAALAATESRRKKRAEKETNGDAT
jgi:ATP-dependent helicase YprA (DUF1998 family)